MGLMRIYYWMGFSEVEFKMPEIIENDNLGLSQNPNNAYMKPLPIRIGDLIVYKNRGKEK